MTKPQIDYLKEARRLARAAGLLFVERGLEKGAEFRVYRKTTSRPVYLGKRGNPTGLFTFIKRCATTQ